VEALLPSPPAPPGGPVQPPPRAIDGAPPWLVPVIRSTIWRIVWVGLGMAVLVLCLLQARALISTLVIALFFSIAMEPAVNRLHTGRGWGRGKAAAVVFLVVVVSVVLLITVLIPALVQVAGQVADKLPGWLSTIEKSLGVTVGSSSNDLGTQMDAAVRSWLQDHAGQVLGLASSTFGVVFQFLTTATFTLYFAADAPKIRRALLVRMPPERQQRVGWAWDTAIEQTGGYFYSRLVLLIINSTLYFFVMVAVGVPWLVALPLSVFQGFFAEFIPVVGTYIGAAVPALVTLGIQGAWQALVLVGWTLVYQQIENYWLSPKLSAQSMSINGGVAFGSALAGGAIAGPMGAFMAMPIAALITSFVTHYVPRYELAYQSPYDTTPADQPAPDGVPTTEPSTEDQSR
jgi:predicted PurR-regulated permease PerM